MTDSSHEIRQEIERTRAALSSIPWWRPIRRQDAARRYRYALLAGAMLELREGDHA